MARPGPWLWPLLVGVLSLAVTGGLWQHERETQTRHLRDNFDFGLRQTAVRVEQRIASYEQMLRGVRGLFDASTLVTAEDFAAYVDALAAGADFAGLRSIAWAPLRRGADGALQAPLGFSAPAADALVGALGQDLHADPVRRAAMLQARDSGNLAATQRLLPDGGTATDAGFLLFMPLYARGQPHGTVAERRVALVGWVFASFGIGDLMSSLYGEGVDGLGVRVHDGVAVSAQTQLYPAPAPAATPPAPGRFEGQEYIAFAGHTWTLVVHATPAFEQRHSSDAATVIAIAGTGLGAVLSLLAWQLATGRERADAAARTMTQQLREGAERYRRIVETASEGIWLLDAELRTAFVNPKMAALLGRSAEELGQRRWTDFMDDAGRARLGSALAAGRGETGQHDVRFLRADGSALWATVSTSPILDAGGRFAGALAMVTDVTERRELEERLRQSQKMEAVGTLAGGIAHDFNNLLAAILGNTSLLADELPASGTAADRLAQVRRAAERGRSLVQQIVTFSRQQPQERVTQPLQPLVSEAAAMLRSTLPSGVTLELQLCEAPLRVNADATQLQQVLLNLCTNAWHAMPSGHGHILIGLDAEPPGPAARRARLWVSDDGMGMDEATQRRVFEPFFTTKPVGKGTGLGLSVVHGIVTAHGGDIGVSSTPGAGTRFDLHLPLADAAPPPAPPAPAAAPAPPPHGGGRHVLVVDDDPVMLPVVQALLQRGGFRVTACADPRQALVRGSATDDPVDVVVTDFNMPGLSGVALARALRLARPRLPVIISSGFVSEALRVEARAAGVLHVLQKEFSLEELQRLIHEALAAGTPGP